MVEGLRILHVLSPVKWDGATFIADADSNWKVAEKTIAFLPKCHHYILVPPKHTITLNQPNITFIPYDYPKSVQLNRGIFDYRNVKFDFTKNDIDFVFTHQPEVAFNIQQWLHTNRYYEDVAYFGFYHWVDCKKSRGSTSGCPSFYMRQLEAMHVLDANFIHSDLSMDYLKSNFGNLDVTELINKTFHMPLSSKIDVEPTDFELPNKKILLFNHRWNKSSGIEKLVEYAETLSDEYLIWVTDDRCDVKSDKFHVERLDYSKYAHLVMNCHASLCFIDGYSTWNLSAQDSLLFNRPLLYFDHPTVRKVIGEEYKGSFKTVEEFKFLLENLPRIGKLSIHDHDTVFEEQLKLAMESFWFDTKKTPKDAPAYRKNIEEGVTDKKTIAFNVNPKVRLNGTAHYVRRNLLHNGIKDNYNSSQTEYFLEENSPPEKVVSEESLKTA